MTSRKACSPTQPGRGIRRVVDLYHDLPDLVDRAHKHALNNMVKKEDIDKIDFVGLSEEEIAEERKE
jgi:hypothetical protein